MKTNTREARRPQAKEDDSEADFKRPKFDSRNERGQRGGHRGRGGHRVADHVKNPEKYTKYSLKDVPEISNKSNSAAAFDFLQKLGKEKNDEEEEPAADLSQKIVFKKRGKKESKSNDEQNEPNVSNCIEELQSGHLAGRDEIQMWVNHTEYLALIENETPDVLINRIFSIYSYKSEDR